MKLLLKKSLLDSYQNIPDKTYYSRNNIVPIITLEEYFIYLDDYITTPPTSKYLWQQINYFYWLINQETGLEIQYENSIFTLWLTTLINENSIYLDTYDSIKNINQFIENPEYNIKDYIIPVKGFKSFNNFFTREIKQWLRKIDNKYDSDYIVSPADCFYKGLWKITNKTLNKKIYIKNTYTTLEKLINNSLYINEYYDGFFTHCFLNVTDYHRLHTPINGIVKESFVINGKAGLKTYWDNENKMIQSYTTNDWQQYQERGILTIENKKYGFITTLPIGMAQVSSVNLFTTINDDVDKGDRFGHFEFGGSDCIILFNKNIDILENYFDIENPNNKINKKHQGEKIFKIKLRKLNDHFEKEL